jgi:hypothetical protein
MQNTINSVPISSILTAKNYSTIHEKKLEILSTGEPTY